MAMIKRAKGTIEEMVDKDTANPDNEPNLTWSNDVLIKDVLDVPLTKEADIAINLDEADEDEIAVRV
jgi:hypothetical protein